MSPLPINFCKNVLGEENFEITKAGSSCSDELKDTINSVDECRQAANELSKIFETEIYSEFRRKGCLLSFNTYVYWNNYEYDGYVNGKSQAICRANCKCILSLSIQKHFIQKLDTTTPYIFHTVHSFLQIFPRLANLKIQQRQAKVVKSNC